MAVVLLVDDDLELSERVADYLASDAIVVLDVMMPGLCGVDVLRQIRKVSAVPVLMLTARGDDRDRIIGLELGADDYVPKPCHPRELAARLRAILRRTARQDAEAALPLVIGELTVRPEQRSVEWAGVPVALTSSEFNLIEVLARHAGRPVSKNELSEL